MLSSGGIRRLGGAIIFRRFALVCAALAAAVLWNLTTPASTWGLEAPAWDIPTDARRARVLFVYDGDTIDVRLGDERVRVRYIGIDAPELFDERPDAAAMAREAWAANKALVLGKDVYLVTDIVRHDVYGRLLAYVFVEPTTFVNAWLVEQGYAQVYTFPPNEAHVSTFERLQRQAELRQRGLWALPEFAQATRAAPIKEEQP